MPFTVAAFYQFAALPDFRELREPLRAICAGFELKGSVLLAHEGINGTIAGSEAAIDGLIGQLRDGALFGGRLDHLELKFSSAARMPFRRISRPIWPWDADLAAPWATDSAVVTTGDIADALGASS